MPPEEAPAYITDLPPLEKSILADFRGLDEKGKKAAIAYAEELIKQQGERRNPCANHFDYDAAGRSGIPASERYEHFPRYPAPRH